MYSLIAYGKTINAHLTYYIHTYNRMLLYMNVYDTIKCIFLQCLVVKSSARMPAHVHTCRHSQAAAADWLTGRLFWHAIGELVLRPPVQRCNCARAPTDSIPGNEFGEHNTTERAGTHASARARVHFANHFLHIPNHTKHAYVRVYSLCEFNNAFKCAISMRLQWGGNILDNIIRTKASLTLLLSK